MRDLEGLIEELRAMPDDPDIDIKTYERIWPFALALTLICAVALERRSVR